MIKCTKVLRTDLKSKLVITERTRTYKIAKKKALNEQIERRRWFSQKIAKGPNHQVIKQNTMNIVGHSKKPLIMAIQSKSENFWNPKPVSLLRFKQIYRQSQHLAESDKLACLPSDSEAKNLSKNLEITPTASFNHFSVSCKIVKKIISKKNS